METQTHGADVQATHTEATQSPLKGKSAILALVTELVNSNENLFLKGKSKDFLAIINEALKPQRVRNDNPYQYGEDGSVIAIHCTKYNRFLPVELFPAPIEGKYKTTSKVASWKYNELEKQIKAIESETMAKIFAGVAVDTELVKSSIEELKSRQKTDYIDFDTDFTAWENREGKRS